MPESVTITVRPKFWRWTFLWLGFAKVCFRLGGWCLSRVGFDVHANGRKIGSRHVTGELVLKVDDA
jgi:hypothetical protein